MLLPTVVLDRMSAHSGHHRGPPWPSWHLQAGRCQRGRHGQPQAGGRRDGGQGVRGSGRDHSAGPGPQLCRTSRNFSPPCASVSSTVKWCGDLRKVPSTQQVLEHALSPTPRLSSERMQQHFWRSPGLPEPGCGQDGLQEAGSSGPGSSRTAQVSGFAPRGRAGVGGGQPENWTAPANQQGAQRGGQKKKSPGGVVKTDSWAPLIKPDHGQSLRSCIYIKGPGSADWALGRGPHFKQEGVAGRVSDEQTRQ